MHHLTFDMGKPTVAQSADGAKPVLSERTTGFEKEESETGSTCNIADS